jgi:CheY-like chemotaxis protein
MYEIFTGKKPFDGDTPLVVAMKHHKEPPVQPREVNEFIPEHIEKIILKCLEKNPEDRFQHAGEILEAFDHGEEEPPVEDETMRILVADDDSAVRDLLVYYLEKNGYDTIIAKNGEEAVAKSIEEKPSLILMDLMMPGMDGLQATEILKKNTLTSDIPVIMITAKDDSEYKAYVKSIGIMEYVTKPIDIQAVLDKVKTILPVPE